MFKSLRALHLPFPVSRETSRSMNWAYPDTLMSRSAGGPIYQMLRKNFTDMNRYWVRRPLRFIDLKWDMGPAAFHGVPELHLDPRRNQWIYAIPTHNWGGLKDKLVDDFFSFVLWYPFMALIIFIFYQRCKTNETLFFRKNQIED